MFEVHTVSCVGGVLFLVFVLSYKCPGISYQKQEDVTFGVFLLLLLVCLLVF